MKKLLAVIAIALVAAAAAWIFVRVQLVNRLVTVPELLPKTTLFLVHVPDVKRARERWQASDLYQIWREPSVQSWLQKPLGRLPQNGKGRQTLEEFLQLGPTHAFVALASLENNEPKLVGGFHFAETQEKAKQFIAQREAKWWPKASDAKRETIVYEQHQIETLNVSHFVFARAFDNHWFFASNNLAALKALLDRVDRRREKKEPSLKDDEAFAAARKHLAGEYEGLLFVDPRPFVEKLMPLIFMAGQSLPAAQVERLKSVRRRGGRARIRTWQDARDRFCGDAAGRHGQKIDAPAPCHRRGRHFFLFCVADVLAGQCFLTRYTSGQRSLRTDPTIQLGARLARNFDR